MASVTSSLLLACVFCCFYVSAQRREFQRSFQENGFNFTNCNRSAVPLHVSSLILSPHPIQLDKEILLLTKFSLDRNIGENHKSIEVDLNLRLKTDRGYTELCEIIGEDNCHYNDICMVLQNYTKKRGCPSEFWVKYHNNCSCPFIKGQYSLPIQIAPHPISFTLRGTFDLTINLMEEGNHLGCVNMQFCINKCNPLNPNQSDKEFMEMSRLDRKEPKRSDSNLTETLNFP